MPIVPLDENMAPLGPATKTPATFIRVDHALVGGRVDREALLRSFATITFAPGGKCVACQGGLVWTNGIQLGICGGGDLTDESVTDFGDPLQSCTALSVGLGFTAFPAQVGPPYDNDAAVPLSVCDASTYTCP
jgi:hypothetical protein